MPNSSPRYVTVRGRREPVLETVRVGGRRYDLLEKLSSRGVYRVYDSQAGPRGGYRVLQRFPDRRGIGQRLEVLNRLAGPNANPNYPSIQQCARSGGDWAVVTSWVAGIGLRDYLRSVREKATSRPSVPEVVRICRGLAHGLYHYHRRLRLIHGDVSPANLILTRHPTRLVLVDFGSAWPIERSAGKDSGDGRSPIYAAPERIANHAAEDFRSDAFSLAVIAYELLTLEIPYDGVGGGAGVPGRSQEFAGTLKPVASCLGSIKRRLPKRAIRTLDDCLQGGLELSPDNRFNTSQEWLDSWDRTNEAFRQTHPQGGPVSRAATSMLTRLAALFQR